MSQGGSGRFGEKSYHCQESNHDPSVAQAVSVILIVYLVFLKNTMFDLQYYTATYVYNFEFKQCVT